MKNLLFPIAIISMVFLSGCMDFSIDESNDTVVIYEMHNITTETTNVMQTEEKADEHTARETPEPVKDKPTKTPTILSRSSYSIFVWYAIMGTILGLLNCYFVSRNIRNQVYDYADCDFFIPKNIKEYFLACFLPCFIFPIVGVILLLHESYWYNKFLEIKKGL